MVKRGLNVFLFMILAVSIFSVFSFSIVSALDPKDPSVLIYISGDSSVSDDSSYNRKLYNFGVVSTNETGHSGNSLKFNGTSFFNVSLPDSFAKDDDFTLDMWVYRNTTLGGGGASNYRQYILKGTTDIFTDTSNGALGSYSLQVGTTGITLQCAKNATSSCIPPYGWHRITITRFGSTAYLFVDGIFKDKDTASAYALNNIGKTIFANVGVYSKTSSPYNWNGYIDEISLRRGADLSLIGELQAYFPFDDNSDEKTGNIKAVPTNVKYNPSLVGKAAYFDGSGDYITLNAATPIVYGTTSTTMFWAKRDAGNTNYYLFEQPVYTLYGMIGDDSYGTGASYCKFGGKGSFTLIRNSWTCVVQGKTSYSTDYTWHHFAIVDDGTRVKLYVDGKNEDQNAVPAASYASLSKTEIRRMAVLATNEHGWYYYKGSLDEFKVYNSVLNYEEIRNEYCKGMPGDNVCVQPPVFVAPTPENNSNIADAVTINVSSSKSVSSCTLTFVNTNYTMNIITNGAQYSLASLGEGNYSYFVTCDGAKSETRTFGVTHLANVSEAIWTNLNGDRINRSDKNDLVMLRVTGQNLENQEINYTVKKQNLFWFDKKIAVTSSVGYTTLRINESGTYYYTATLPNGKNIRSSTPDLEVLNSINNEPTKISIVSPACGANYTLNETINFIVNISDSDDFVSGYFNSDGQRVEINNLQQTGSVVLNKSGNIHLVANVSDGKTVTRAISNIMVIDSTKNGIYLAACITSPADTSNIGGGNVTFDASKSKGINYTNGQFAILPGSIFFNWTFYTVSGSTMSYFANYTNFGASNFDYSFPAGTYTALLEISK